MNNRALVFVSLCDSSSRSGPSLLAWDTRTISAICKSRKGDSVLSVNFPYNFSFTTLRSNSTDEKLIFYSYFSQKIGFDISFVLSKELFGRGSTRREGAFASSVVDYARLTQDPTRLACRHLDFYSTSTRLFRPILDFCLINTTSPTFSWPILDLYLIIYYRARSQHDSSRLCTKLIFCSVYKWSKTIEETTSWKLSILWAKTSETDLSDVRPAKIQISLRIRAVWSESSLDEFK